MAQVVMAIIPVLVRAQAATNPSVMATPYTHQWNFADAHDVWTAGGTCTAAVNGGILQIHSTGGNPYVRSPAFSVDVNQSPIRVTVKMKSSSAGMGQILWSNLERDFDEQTSAHFTITHDGSWHEYVVDLPTKGVVQRLRLHPGTAAGEVEIAWIKLVVVSEEEPGIPVFLEGVLLDQNNQPVNEGFVMLRDNPQLNAITGFDGRFRIEGNAWSMPDFLLASWTGCDSSQVKLETPQAKDLTIRLHAQDPTFSKIEMGMSLKVRWFNVYSGSRPLNAGQKQCVQQYEEFLKDKGDAIIDKMLAGTALSDDEKKYESILASQIWARTSQAVEYSDNDPHPEVRYCAKVYKEFYRVSLKAIRRQRLTDADVHAMRLMSAVFGSSGFGATGVGYVRGMGVKLPDVAAGAPLPFDVPLIQTSPLLKSPGWTDYTTLSATAYLRLEGIWPMLDSYWKWQVQHNRLVESPVQDWKRRYWQDWYHVSSVNELVKKANGKPVYISCSNFEDGTAFGFYTRQNEYFRRAFAGQADVYHVSQATDDAFVDIFVDEWSHYGPNPQANPLLGYDNARWEDRNYTPFRHARMDKLCFMNVPFPSGEIWQDLTREGSFLLNKVGFHMQVVLDRDGRVSVPFPAGDWYVIPTRFFASYEAYCSYQRLGGESYFFSLVHEQMLRALIANGGRFTNGGPFEPGTFDRILQQYPRIFHAKDDVFIVKSVDKERQIIHAGWFDPGGAAGRARAFGAGNPVLNGTEPRGDFALKLQPDARFEVRCKDGKPTWIPAGSEDEPAGVKYRLASLDEFKPGDRFLATIRFPWPVSEDVPMSELMSDDYEIRNRPSSFDMAKYDGKELAVERIMNYVHHSSYGGTNARFMPLYGRVTKKDGQVITVSISADEVKEMWGYRFWSQEQAKGRKPEQMDGLFFPILKRWADGADDDRTYRFKIDGATDVYRNGLVAEPRDVAVGDYVYVEYEMWWEKQQMQREIIPPERIQASDPVIAPYEAPIVRALKKQGVPGTSEDILKQLEAPKAELLPLLTGAMSENNARTRDDVVNVLALLVKNNVCDVKTISAALEKAIADNKIADEAAYKYRRSFTSPAVFLRNWLMIGPFPNTELQGFDATYGPETEPIDPTKKYPGQGGDVSWKKYESETDFINCAKAIKPVHFVVGYGVCWVKVDKDQEIALEIGSQMGCKVWVNRQQVLRDHRQRGAIPAQDHVFAHLKAGWNEVLFKTEHGGPGKWGYYVQLYAMDGMELKAEYTALPPK